MKWMNTDLQGTLASLLTSYNLDSTHIRPSCKERVKILNWCTSYSNDVAEMITVFGGYRKYSYQIYSIDIKWKELTSPENSRDKLFKHVLFIFKCIQMCLFHITRLLNHLDFYLDLLLIYNFFSLTFMQFLKTELPHKLLESMSTNNTFT